MATDQNSDTTQTPPLAQLRHELGRYVGARARRTARRAGHRLSEAADRLLDVDEDSGTVPKVGSRVLHGESPAAAIAAETGRTSRAESSGRSGTPSRAATAIPTTATSRPTARPRTSSR